MLNYNNSGVSIAKADLFVDKIRTRIGTHRNVLSNLSEFAALYDLAKLKFKNPVLVSGTDGVGTKLKLAFKLNKHDTIGIDLVAMCVNDVITTGALPLFFLDYFACGKLNLDISERVIDGIIKGCDMAGCALVGGETAEMPGFYANNEYDLAGFCVGVVEKNEIINGKGIKVGDSVIGIKSSGFHSNGYSLLRNIIEKNSISLSKKIKELDGTLGDALLKPTFIYSKLIQKLKNKFSIKGIAHITGGGIAGNLERIIPDRLCAIIDVYRWNKKPIFSYIQQIGKIDTSEMYRVFNMGLGLIIIVKKDLENKVLKEINLNGFKAFVIGMVEKNTSIEKKVVLRNLYE